MICGCQKSSLKPPVENFFTVGPVQDLGDDLGRAVLQLGGDTRFMLSQARGFIMVDGAWYRRLPEGVERDDVLRVFSGSGLRLGEAVGLVEEQIIYRELDTNRATLNKAIDPLSEKGFLSIVNRIARALRRATDKDEAKAVRQAIDRLDVDWPNLSDKARSEVVRAANKALENLPKVVVPKVDSVLSVEADKTVSATRVSVRRKYGLRIGADLSQTDKRIARYVRQSQTNFVRDEFARRRTALSEKARKIASDGISQGLGRDEISRELNRAFRETVANRNAYYWDVVASAFVNHARSYTELSSYAEAGVEYYLISAVIDEVTTDVCRFLDGKRFSVSAAISRFNRLEKLRDPERIKLEHPWLHIRQDNRGNRAIFVPTDTSPVRVATVEDSAELRGLKDERGVFRDGLSPSRLETLNIGPPPYHGLCRTTALPEV